jgi:formate hydrogenlyase subunit 6/NADH:ubiquinone oxidoreductase subunit I
MTDKKIKLLPEMSASKPIILRDDLCIGCMLCVDICQVDVLIPDPVKENKVPLVLFPGECWYCGSCVEVCPVEGAIELRHPLMNQVHWIEKSRLTGK